MSYVPFMVVVLGREKKIQSHQPVVLHDTPGMSCCLEGRASPAGLLVQLEDHHCCPICYLVMGTWTWRDCAAGVTTTGSVFLCSVEKVHQV